MYGFVPYNISEIQKGIQFGHGVVEYAQKYFKDKTYQQWAKDDKTFIILNGGTTNEDEFRPGTLQTHYYELVKNKIECATFDEPDLNDALTAVVFLVDERVYDKVKYPDLIYKSPHRLNADIIGMSTDRADSILYDEERARAAWIKSIGGAQNAFLREFLSKFRLA